MASSEDYKRRIRATARLRAVPGCREKVSYNRSTLCSTRLGGDVGEARGALQPSGLYKPARVTGWTVPAAAAFMAFESALVADIYHAHQCLH